MIEAARDGLPAAAGHEPIRWLRNGRAFEQPVDDVLLREAGACIASTHAFDDLHRATGYSPARLTYVALDPGEAGRNFGEVELR